MEPLKNEEVIKSPLISEKSTFQAASRSVPPSASRMRAPGSAIRIGEWVAMMN